MVFPLILFQYFFMDIKYLHFSCRAICPDFFVGQGAWQPSNDWATFDDWLKTRDAGKIDKYSYCSLTSKWTSLFRRNFCLSKDVALDPKLLVGHIKLDVHKWKFHAAHETSLWLYEGCFMDKSRHLNKNKSAQCLLVQRVEAKLMTRKQRTRKS